MQSVDLLDISSLSKLLAMFILLICFIINIVSDYHVTCTSLPQKQFYCITPSESYLYVNLSNCYAIFDIETLHKIKLRLFKNLKDKQMSHNNTLFNDFLVL